MLSDRTGAETIEHQAYGLANPWFRTPLFEHALDPLTSFALAHAKLNGGGVVGSQAGCFERFGCGW